MLAATLEIGWHLMVAIIVLGMCWVASRPHKKEMTTIYRPPTSKEKQ